jgi:hypothetical protein
MRVVPSTSVPAPIAARRYAQVAGRPRRHAAHFPQDGAQWMITRSPGATSGHLGADGLDDSAALVPEDHWRGPRPLAAEHVQVAAAHADGGHAHQDVLGARHVELDLRDFHGPRSVREQRRPHPHRGHSGYIPYTAPGADAQARLGVPLVAVVNPWLPLHAASVQPGLMARQRAAGRRH